MSALDRQVFFKGFRKKLYDTFGKAEGLKLWAEAGKEYDDILKNDPSLKSHKGAMALSAVALYRVLERNGKDGEGLLNDFGRTMGKKYAKIVHVLTSIPGVDRLLWNNIEKIMDKMSGEDLGYKREIVSEPPAMYGVDILSCPYHDICKQLGNEKAALCICSMDKEYMKGFHHIRYERETSVAEGADCCDYRLRFDKNKK